MHKQVQNSYNIIAKQFSQTRNYNWPEFEVFINFLKERGNLDLEYNILDIWCWNWRLCWFLWSHIPKLKYTWSDISSGLLWEAQKSYPKEKFICQDMTDLSNFKDNSFDLIFSIAAFHHIYLKEDRIKHLKHLKRILKPWWFIFMTNWNLFQKKYISCFLKNIFQKKEWNDCLVPFHSWGKNLTSRYYHAFTKNELRSLFKKSGLKMEKEFFMKKKDIKKNFWWSFNICHVLR